MMTELDAIFASDLATTIFVYGSVALISVSLIAILWLSKPAQSKPAFRSQVMREQLS